MKAPPGGALFAFTMIVVAVTLYVHVVMRLLVWVWTHS